jgi:hypothetical protein
MPRVLADGKTKFTILTTEPADPEAPTAAELNAGIDLSCKVLASDFNWSATDSDKISEPALCDDANANSLGKSNYQAGFTLWRYYLDGGGVDTTADAGFAAVKEKGATLWGYARLTDKASTEVWATSDEIYLGGEFTVDTPQRPNDNGGWLKWRVPAEMQRAWDFITVAAGA